MKNCRYQALSEAVKSFKVYYVASILEVTHGHIGEAAELLEVHRNTLYVHIREAAESGVKLHPRVERRIAEGRN